MGQVQHTKHCHVSARGRRLGWRTCLRKGCGRRFKARRQNQRYCQELECRKELHRWQAAKRQQKRRAGAEGRRRHAEAERQRRKRKASAGETSQEGQPAPTAADPARGHAAQKHPEVFCDRPGCYEPVRESTCAPASYCGDDCRAAMNQVRDRERKCLRRNDPEVRNQRHLEYQATSVKRRRRRVAADNSTVSASSAPPRPLPAAVFHSGFTDAWRLDFKDSREPNRHDPQANPSPRPRAPPAQ